MKKLLNIFATIKQFFMGVKFGEIDAGQIVLNEFRIGVLENIIDLLIAKNPDLHKISKEDLDLINKRVELELQKKYPYSGIQINRKTNV